MNTLKELRIRKTSENHLSLFLTFADSEYWVQRVFNAADLDALASGFATVTDCYHKIEGIGDQWLLYDLDTGRMNRASGELTISYRRLTVPRFIAKLLGRLLRSMPIDASIDVPQATRDRWVRVWGQATGSVEIECSDGARQLLALYGDDPELADRIEHIKQIARNRTSAKYQRARIELYADQCDTSGFYWCAYAPDGLRIMNGGIINHSRQYCRVPDWSIHT